MQEIGNKRALSQRLFKINIFRNAETRINPLGEHNNTIQISHFVGGHCFSLVNHYL